MTCKLWPNLIGLKRNPAAVWFGICRVALVSFLPSRSPLCSVFLKAANIDSQPTRGAGEGKGKGGGPLVFSPLKRTRNMAAKKKSCRRGGNQQTSIPKILKTTPKSSNIPKNAAKNRRKAKEEVPIKKRQSPIDIRPEDVCYDPISCQRDSLCVRYSSGDCCDVATNSIGFMVNVSPNCTSILQASHLSGEFRLAQFHAHWGEDGNSGSEHRINGQPMSGEVHFVFWNTKYAHCEEAMKKDDGLAVLAVFLKEGVHSSEYEQLFDVVQRATAENGRSISVPKNFSLEQLLPNREDRNFVTYLGSLTTPPFCESVIWTVLLRPIDVSKEQMDIFREILPSNYRNCQDLCHRKVLSSVQM